MTLDGYVTVMERSRRPNDLAVAAFIRRHRTRLLGWLREYGMYRTPAVREELLQQAMLGVCEVVAKGGSDALLNEVRGYIRRHGYADRKRDLREEPVEENVNGVLAPARRVSAA